MEISHFYSHGKGHVMLVTVMPRVKEWISAQAYMPSRLQAILEDHPFSQPQFATFSSLRGLQILGCSQFVPAIPRQEANFLFDLG
jgi:hypothetical protein